MQNLSQSNAQGIDVSHYQGSIDWQKVRAAGKSFAFIKATQGKNIVDDTLQRNAVGAHAASVLIGYYHFFTATTVDDAIAEANNFLQAIDGLPLDLVPAIDVESGILTGTNLQTVVNAWVNYVQGHLNRPVLMYSYPNFIDTHFGNSFMNMPLWLASYSDYAPRDRGGWTSWDFLQTSEEGVVDGITENKVDLNQFDGTEEDLMKLVDLLNGKPVGNKDDGLTILRTWLKPSWDHAEEREEQCTANGDTDGAEAWNKQKGYIGDLGQALRKAFGIAPDED